MMVLSLGGSTGPDVRYRGVAAFAVQHPAIAVLWGTFGTRDDSDCLARYAVESRDRPHLIHFHFSNETCRRNRVCGAGELFPLAGIQAYNRLLEKQGLDTVSRIKARAKRIREFCQRIANPRTKCTLSLGLEDNYTCKAATNLALMLRAEWPYELVRNPFRPRKCKVPVDAVEVHTDKQARAADYVSNDGRNLEDVGGFFRRNDRVSVVYAWDSLSQGREEIAPGVFKFSAPRDREFRFDKRYAARLRTALKRWG